MFEVGSKVIHITPFRDALADFEIEAGVKYPKLKKIYTVRTLEYEAGIVLIRLVEIINPILNYLEGFSEAEFNAAHFAPLISDNTLSDTTFEEILTEIAEMELVNG